MKDITRTVSKSTDVGAQDVAIILNITPKRIAELTKKGVLTKNANRKYAIPQSATDYIRYLQGITGKEIPVSADVPSLEESKAKKMYFDAQLAEAKLAEAKMDSIPLSTVVERDSKIGVAVRTAVMRIPNDMPGQLEGHAPAQMKNILTDCVRSILEELSDDQSELWTNIEKRRTAQEEASHE